MPPEPSPPRVAFLLECIECGDRSHEGRGWRAYLHDQAEVLIYCARCAEQEFGTDE